MSSSCDGYAETIKNIISAINTKNYISIEKLAKMLSGKDEFTSLRITNKASMSGEIAPESLFSLFEK